MNDNTAMLAFMLDSRHLDERCMQMLADGEVLPHYHSGAGQEALMVAPIMELRTSDSMIYTHRGYGHLIAKGISIEKVLRDLFMKAGGTNHGLGGVMHVNDPERGVHGREGVFGTRFGLACGLALADKLAGRDDVTVCFYGEAAGARGPLYEAINMSVLWRLPVIFIAENNGWSFTSRTEWLFPEGRMTRVWEGMLPVEVVDGNDALAVRESVRRAIDRARTGDGPSVIEGMTYRLDPHIWYDDAAYQDPAEIVDWRGKDPIPRLIKALSGEGLTEDETRKLTESSKARVAAAFDAALAAPDASWDDIAEWMVER